MNNSKVIELSQYTTPVITESRNEGWVEFGKGNNHLFPLNAYIDYVIANGEDVDGVVTEISFNENNDNQSVLFKAVDFVPAGSELATIVANAVGSPEAVKVVALNVGSVDKGEADAEEFAPTKETAPEAVQHEEEVSAPTKRTSKKTETVSDAPKKNLADVVNAWSDD